MEQGVWLLRVASGDAISLVQDEKTTSTNVHCV